MFSTSMRKCSAVVFRDAPAWFAAEFLSSVFASVPLVIVILLFVLWFFSDSIRSTSRRTAATPRPRRRSVPAAPRAQGIRSRRRARTTLYSSLVLQRGLITQGPPALAPLRTAASASTTPTKHLGGT